MLEIINWLICGILQILTCNYIVTKLTQQKINYKSFKNILIMILMGLTMVMLVIYQNNALKPLLVYALLVFGYKLILKITFKESVIINFISILIHSITEIIGLVLFVIIFKIPEEVLLNIFKTNH